MDSIRKTNSKTRLPLAALELFEIAGRAKSFTRAAQLTGLSQPAFSHRIRDLEQTLGIPLFHREHRGVALTRAGEMLLSVCSRSLGDIRVAIETIQTGTETKVLIATDFGFSSYWIMPRMPTLRQAVGDIELNLMASQYASIPTLRDVDIHIFLAADCVETDTRRRLFDETAYPVCSPDYFQKVEGVRAPRDLLDHPLLHLAAPGDAPWLTWEQWFASNTIDYAPSATGAVFSNYMLVIQAALSGRGLCLGWKHLVDDLISEGSLVLACDGEICSGRSYCIELLGTRPSESARLIFEEITAIAWRTEA